MAKVKPLPLLLVTWLDAGTISSEWLTREQVLEEAEPGRFINQTVGWLVQETDVALIMASQVATDEKEPRYDLLMFIPKVLIRKRTKLQ
jgi:hypothetical protein